MFEKFTKFLGVESFSIEYDSPTCVFLPGEIIHGHVVINIKDGIKAKAVIVNLIGRGRTSWTIWETYSSYVCFFILIFIN